MNEKYYEIAVKVNERIKNDPKFDPNVRQTAQEILRYKKTPIMSWYLIYLKGLASILEIEGMENLKVLQEVNGVKIHYPANAQELFMLTAKQVIGVEILGVQNRYDADEEKFIASWMSHEKEKPIRIVEYGRMIYFIPESVVIKKKEEIEKTGFENQENKSELVVDKDNETVV